MTSSGQLSSGRVFAVAIWKLPVEIKSTGCATNDKMVAIAWLIEDERKLEYALSFHRRWWGMLLGFPNSVNLWSEQFPNIGKSNRSDLICILRSDKENKIPTLPPIPMTNRGLRQFVRDKMIAYNRLQSSGKIKHLNVSDTALLSSEFSPLPELPPEWRPLDHVTVCSQSQIDKLWQQNKEIKPLLKKNLLYLFLVFTKNVFKELCFFRAGDRLRDEETGFLFIGGGPDWRLFLLLLTAAAAFSVSFLTAGVFASCCAAGVTFCCCLMSCCCCCAGAEEEEDAGGGAHWGAGGQGMDSGRCTSCA